MEPTQGRPRGSFGMPPEMQKKLNETEQKRYEEKVNPAKPQPATHSAPPVTHIADSPDEQAIHKEAKEEQETKQTQLATMRSVIETELNTTLTSEDLKAYIFKGVLKKSVVVAPGLGMKGVFQTLSTEQYQQVDFKMSEVRANSKLTSTGIANENSILLLSHGWLEIDGKSLGSSPQEREVNIRKMGGTFVEGVWETFTNFNTLVKIALNDRGLVKKS